MSTENDEEQICIIHKIIDMLVAGGYFRARLNTLDVWDRIIGGISWAIMATGIPIDIDIEFKHNQSIREKILISEKIVDALKQMNYPYNITPFQIQLIHYTQTAKALFNVTQWLIKCVIDYRRLTGNTTRNYSEFLFDTYLNDERDNKYHLYLINCKNKGREYLTDNVNNTYKPQRRFAKEKDIAFTTNTAYIDATLREYEFNFDGNISFIDTEAVQSIDSMNKMDMKCTDTKPTLSHAITSNYCVSEEVLDVAGYVEVVDVMKYEPVECTLWKKRYSEQRYNKLKKRYNELNMRKKCKIQRYKKMKRKMEELDNTINDTLKERERIKGMIQEFDIQCTSYDNEMISKLMKLVKQNEAIKERQKLLKEEWERDEQIFEQRLAILDKMDENDELKMRIEKLESVYSNDLIKYDEIGQLLAVKNRKYLDLLRRLESYPTRSELLQFEKRFIELDGLTNQRLKEMKKHYDLFNSLKDSYDTMENEVSLWQQIESEFNDRTRREDDRENFIKSMQKTLDTLETNIGNAMNKLIGVKNEKDMKYKEYNELLSYQREYYLYLNQLENLCNINQQINDRIDVIKSKLKRNDE